MCGKLKLRSNTKMWRSFTAEDFAEFGVSGFSTTIAERYDLPVFDGDFPSRIVEWDTEFMRLTGWPWTRFYGALVEMKSGFNPDAPSPVNTIPIRSIYPGG